MRGARNLLIILAVLVIVALQFAVRKRKTPEVDPPRPSAPAAPARAPVPPADAGPDLLKLVTPPADRREEDGIAVALLVDTSRSMSGSVRDLDGSRRPKLEIARRAARGVIGRLKGFVDSHPGRPLKLGIYQFSGSTCRRLGPFDLLDHDRAVRDLEKLTTGSGTPIGEAMLTGKHDLDRSGLAKKHLVLLTDGENTIGRDPARVARTMAALPPEQQVGLYFIAFDVDAARFRGIRDAGGTVLEASSAPELDQCLDYILEKKILLELPEFPARK